MATKWESVDAYLAAQPDNVRSVLEQIRATICAAVPDAEQVISYNIPCFRAAGKPVIYMAGWTSHVSIYPLPHDDLELREELTPLVASKGTVRLALNKPIPYELVGRMAKALRSEI